MGKLWDRLTGTARPGDGVEAWPREEVRAALLAVGETGTVYRVRHARPDEKADLVTECDLPGMGVRLKSSMRLDADRREVRVLHESWHRHGFGEHECEYGRGYASAVYVEWRTERGPDGRHRRVKVNFHTREMTDPIRDTVLGAGRPLRGVLRL